jgi:hypothetical protein
MIMIVPKEKLDEVVLSLEKENIIATSIGEIVKEGVVSVKGGLEKPIDSPKAMNFTKLLKDKMMLQYHYKLLDCLKAIY